MGVHLGIPWHAFSQLHQIVESQISDGSWSSDIFSSDIFPITDAEKGRLLKKPVPCWFEKGRLRPKNSQTKCQLIGWRSSSLKRVARSNAAAEVQAANNGQEDLEYTRLAYYEMSRAPFDLKNAWELIRHIKGTLAIGAKDMWDSCVKRESSALGMLDKRAALEALALHQALRWSGTELRWIHSHAMIADALAMCSSAAWQRLERFLQTSSWRLVDDPVHVFQKQKPAWSR